MKNDASAKRSWFGPSSALTRVTTIALLINVVMYVVYIYMVYVAADTLIIPLVIISGAMLLATLISAVNLRWTPAVGALFALATVTGGLLQPYFPSDLAHPGMAGAFISVTLICASAFVAIVGGIAATLQNYRSTIRTTPRGLTAMLTGITCLVIGAILVSVIVATNPQNVTASTTSSSEPTVTMGATNFDQNVVLVPKGSKLKLQNESSSDDHIIANGQWNANGSVTHSNEPGAPVVNNVNINGGSAEIGPFNIAGVYHLYCSIHRGMNLTVVVQ